MCEFLDHLTWPDDYWKGDRNCLGLEIPKPRSDMEDIRENLIPLEAKESADSYLGGVKQNMKYKF